jgi:hypothetical protein
VNKLVPDVSASDVSIMFGRNAVINITGPNDRTGDIVVVVNGNEYHATMINGNASVTVRDLAVGDYPVSVTYLANDKYV